METLNQMLTSISNEYARQVTKLLDESTYEWIGHYNTFGTCVIGEDYWFTLDELQIIVDDMDKWVNIYKTRDNVASEIIKWQRRWNNSSHRAKTIVCKDYVTHIVPNINLRSWLMGLRESKNQNSITVKYKLLSARAIVEEFGWNINLMDIIHCLEKARSKCLKDEGLETEAMFEALQRGKAPENVQKAYDEFSKDSNDVHFF